jgi:hypothetical protein
VVARICLDMLQSRRTRGEQPLDGLRPFAVLAFTVIGDRAVAIDVFNAPELVAKLDICGITA